jgi:hypothetical protein
MSKKSLAIIFAGLFIFMVPITTVAQTEGVSLEKDVFLNTPILGPEDLPESITFKLYDNKDALISIGSQTFNRGQYTVDFEFSKSDGVSGGDVARVRAEFTEKLNLTDAQGESIKPEELWIALAVGDEEVGLRTKVSDEAMVQLLLNSDASIATYLTLVYEGDDNPIATIYKDLPMSTITGGGSYSSLKDYFTVVASTGEATLNADTRADYWLAGTGGIYYSGNVGVNNTAPNRDISVKYSSSYGGLENLPTISVANTNTTPGQHSFASFEFSGANGGVVGEFFADGGGFFLGGQQSVVFRSSTYDHMIFGTNATNRMIIDRDGDVGIGTGTSLPNELLELAGDGRAFFGDGGGANRTGLLIDGNESGSFARLEAYDYGTSTGMDLVMNTVGKGNVGIGTATPEGSLHVNANSTVSDPQLLLEESAPDYARLSFRNSASSNYFSLAGRPNATDALALLNVYYSGSGGNIMTFTGAGDVGIGQTDPQSQRLWVKKSKSSGHVAVFENSSTSTSADVLVLKVTAATPGAGNNFITFQKGGFSAVGNIDGNGGGGVRYNTSGADFAEWLPKLLREEVIEPGDIVGVVGGKITKQTDNADYVQAISTAPGWVVNLPSEEEKGAYEQVAFMGQVPVRVCGSVKVGYYIVSSGLNDGTGVAVSPDELRAEHHGKIIGRAWEASTIEGEKMINTVVSHNSLPHELYREKDQQIEKLASEVEALKRTLGELMKKMESLTKSQS